MSAFDFTGRHVVITGASMGIGFAVARAFAAAGAALTILAETEAIEAAATALVDDFGRPVRALRCDIADRAAVHDAIGALPAIDVLINNAGYQPMTPLIGATDASDADFERCIAVNVLGTYHVTRAALPLMSRGGRIIVTSSIWGKTGAAGFSGYAASKHAVAGFMRSLAMELGPLGITVNAVCPGWVTTEGAMWTIRAEAADLGMPVSDLIARYLGDQPIPGMMPPDAVAPTYLFLASDGAGDITGQAFNVDRGSFIG
ncbi:SDR family oxidoreductase [Zavarzinia compransoris]|uniref:SDR family NAD(P)-dependent oxidoreductase n=1 Tax=Zavarzinia marina TaxID=2911065 RepID=UPI001F1D43F9|nr:SDR family NAD(P)-dependent oxidoreductase [Zavarzinia marina]MCF4165331.1 SDR family oxidoreductase [Zavarzinia marina]